MARTSASRRQRPTETNEHVPDDSNSGNEEAYADAPRPEQEHPDGSPSDAPVAKSMGDIMGKLLRTSAPAEPILSKRRAVERRLEEEALERRARVLVRQEAREARDAAHTAPALDNREKGLRRVATRGVVQLFNAVHQHQVARERRLQEGRGAKNKGDIKAAATAAVDATSNMRAVSKASFLELLKVGGAQKAATPAVTSQQQQQQ